MGGTEGDNRWRGRGKARVGEKRKRVKEDKNSAIKIRFKQNGVSS